MPTQAELKAQRRADSEKELAKRKEQAEKAVKKTTGTLSSTAQKIKDRERRMKEALGE